MSALPDHIEVISKTSDLRFEDIDIVVTLPTFRRPDHLIRTLDMLKAQKTEKRFAVIVIENEAEKGKGPRWPLRCLRMARTGEC